MADTLQPTQGIRVKLNKVYLYDNAVGLLAEDWATKTDGKVVKGGQEVDYSAKAYAIGGTGTETNNAKYYKEQSDANAAAALASQTAAAGSAAAASGSASSAAGSAGNAAGSAAAALSSQNAAANSASSASGSANTATNRASAASASATAAALSETNAGNSAGAAALSATNSENSASASATSAIQSASSASAASASQTAAATSATTAQKWAEGTPEEPMGGHSAKWWAEHTGLNPAGDYSASTTYNKKDFVRSIAGSNYSFYLSLEDNNTGNPLTDTTKWFFLWSVIGGTTISWGSIEGNINNQPDLVAALALKQAVISDLETIRSGAAAGATAASTISGYGNVVTHNISEFATAAQGAKADTALQAAALTPYRTSSAQDVIDAKKQDLATALNYNNISNCITHIPQDIKLELNNGTLTLKSGSIITAPNGTQKVTTQDQTTSINTDGQYLLFVSANTGSFQLSANHRLDKVGSGSSLPEDGSTYLFFFNTSDETIYRWASNSWIGWSVAFPIGIITASNGAISSIDQVFNGFGFIGSTVFALPGVKGLIPDGRNADGSLKNTELNFTSIITKQVSGTNNDLDVLISSNYIGTPTNGYKYNEQENYNYIESTQYSRLHLGKISVSSGQITSFTPKTAFHAIDYNDKGIIAGLGMPSGKYINLTLGASGTHYTAPANGWFYLRKITGSSGLVFYEFSRTSPTLFTLTNTSNGNANTNVGTIFPVKKGDDVKLNYNATGTTDGFRFVYAEGEV